MVYGREWVDPANPGSVARPDRPEVPTRGHGAGWKLLPPVPPELLGRSLSLFGAARDLGAAINVHYATAALVDLGEPALLASEQFREGVPEVRAYVETAVRPLPKEAPSLPEGGTARERMLRDTVREALVAGYPYQAGYRFAGRILTDQWIARQHVPALRQAIASGHPFLRRNAVYTLASLVYARDPGACEALRGVAARRLDSVAWYRAVRTLADARDPQAREIVLSQLPGRDPVAATFLLRQLGTLADGTTAGALVAASVAFDADPDVQWAFLEAAGRLESDHAPLRERIAALLRRWPEKREDSKAAILRTLATRALDRADGGRRVQDLADRSRRRARGAALQDFPFTVRGAVVEELARVRWPHLAEVAKDREESEAVRTQAVAAGLWTGADAAWLAEIVNDRNEPLTLRAAAAVQLLKAKPDAGREAAVRLVDSYSGGLLGDPAPDGEHSLMDCIEALGPALPSELLGATLEAAVDLRVRNGMRKQGEFAETLAALLVARGEAARPVLERVVAGRESVYRGNAAFGLSHLDRARAAQLLEHGDPFVRQCAAFGLEKNFQAGADVDWTRGGAEARSAAAKAVRAALGLP